MRITINWDLDGAAVGDYLQPNWYKMVLEDTEKLVLPVNDFGEKFKELTRKLNDNFPEDNLIHKFIVWLPLNSTLNSTDYGCLRRAARLEEERAMREFDVLEVFSLPYGTPKRSVFRERTNIFIDGTIEIWQECESAKRSCTAAKDLTYDSLVESIKELKKT